MRSKGPTSTILEITFDLSHHERTYRTKHNAVIVAISRVRMDVLVPGSCLRHVGFARLDSCLVL
jgi:hypothetical protein